MDSPLFQVLDCVQYDLNTLEMTLLRYSNPKETPTTLIIRIKIPSHTYYFTTNAYMKESEVAFKYSPYYRKFFKSEEFFKGYKASIVNVCEVCMSPPSKWWEEMYPSLVNSYPSTLRVWNAGYTILDAFLARHKYIRTGAFINIQMIGSEGPKTLEKDECYAFESSEMPHYDHQYIRFLGVSPYSQQESSFYYWNVHCLEVIIEKSTDRPTPVASWTTECKQYGMAYEEVKDQKVQRIRGLRMYHHSQQLGNIANVINDLSTKDHSLLKPVWESTVLKEDTITTNEQEVGIIGEFIEYFESLLETGSLHVLAVWHYEIGLEYIVNRAEDLCRSLGYTESERDEFQRCIYLSSLERARNTLSKCIQSKSSAFQSRFHLPKMSNEYNWKTPEELHQKCISVGYKRYTSPQGYIYLSTSQLHDQICSNINKFSQLHLFAHYWPSLTQKISVDTAGIYGAITIGLLFEASLLKWIVRSSEVICNAIGWRSILGPFWKTFRRVLYDIVPPTQFVFGMEWHGIDSEKSSGGMVFEAVLNGIHENVGMLDISGAYPSAILEYGICYTTLFNPTSSTKQKNGDGEDSPPIYKTLELVPVTTATISQQQQQSSKSNQTIFHLLDHIEIGNDNEHSSSSGDSDFDNNNNNNNNSRSNGSFENGGSSIQLFEMEGQVSEQTIMFPSRNYLKRKERSTTTNNSSSITSLNVDMGGVGNSLDSNSSRSNGGGRSPNSPSTITKPTLCHYVVPSVRVGVIPLLIQDLANIRSQYTSQKDEFSARLVKLFANQIYGMTHSGTIFHNTRIARSITTAGQIALQRLKKEILSSIPSSGKDQIIAGDTDGIMIKNVSKNELDAIALQFNKVYQYIKVKVSSYFQAVIVITRKNYIALGEDGTSVVIRGTDAVRSDRCTLTKTLLRNIYSSIFSYHTTHGSMFEKMTAETFFDHFQKFVYNELELYHKQFDPSKLQHYVDVIMDQPHDTLKKFLLSKDQKYNYIQGLDRSTLTPNYAIEEAYRKSIESVAMIMNRIYYHDNKK